MRIVIVDDEPKSRSTLTTMIKRYCEGVEITGEAGNITDARSLILQQEPDLVFLDISMPGGTGFDLLKSLNQVQFQIIFVTAYNQYAIEAIRSNAVDYLLKPVNITELQSAVTKATENRSKKSYSRDLTNLLSQFHEYSQVQKLAIPDKKGLVFIDYNDVVRLEADGGYTNVYLVKGTRIVSTRYLKEFEDLLPGSSFFRPHHSHIINLNYIKHYERGEGGAIVMIDNSMILLSKRRKKFFLEKFRL